MAQYLHGGQNPTPNISDAIAKMEYDIHTTPQAPWLQGITPRLFKLENIKKLWDHLRITADVHHQKRIEPTLELQPEHEAAILDFYADDFKLWENAE